MSADGFQQYLDAYLWRRMKKKFLLESMKSLAKYEILPETLFRKVLLAFRKPPVTP
jgi:hypothetical protein